MYIQTYPNWPKYIVGVDKIRLSSLLILYWTIFIVLAGACQPQTDIKTVFGKGLLDITAPTTCICLGTTVLAHHEPSLLFSYEWYIN